MTAVGMFGIARTAELLKGTSLRWTNLLFFNCVAPVEQFVIAPKHVPQQLKKAGKLSAVRAKLLGTKRAPVPVHATNAVFQEWSGAYRALLTFVLLNASEPMSYQPPQIFYIKLSMPFEISPDTKARDALRVEDAEVLTLEEFRRATVKKSYHLFFEENGQLLDGFNPAST
ncbi:hypothetical protein DXG01_009170 [Tephrocybe rancida]|nr:hypothetical protein DXG01_009170 [Tephrocybe rancida]